MTEYLYAQLRVQRDPSKATADAAHIDVHRKLLHAQAQQHNTGHALAPQALQHTGSTLSAALVH